MADDTSGVEPQPRVARVGQHFRTIVVVGGGCYGSYYVRQLGRAARAGAISWEEVLVVDRDGACQVANLPAAELPPATRVEVADWHGFFSRYLGDAAADPVASGADAIVPSPLMPHLMADWLIERAAARWPGRRVATAPLVEPPRVPWQRAGADGTHYVSFADWMCPINCIEPARCPVTKGDRHWSMPPALAEFVAGEAASGRPIHGPYVFQCIHRAYGVGMLDTRDVVAADSEIAARGATGPAEFLVGTVSHCHGALRRIVVGA
jgi:hypothetical protein